VDGVLETIANPCVLSRSLAILEPLDQVNPEVTPPPTFGTQLGILKIHPVVFIVPSAT
jgi:hypothetical protein